MVKTLALKSIQFKFSYFQNIVSRNSLWLKADW